MKFIELIKTVLQENNNIPMSGREIWAYAASKGYDKELNTSGKEPLNTLTSILYTDKNKFIKHSSNPVRFTLNNKISIVKK